MSTTRIGPDGTGSVFRTARKRHRCAHVGDCASGREINPGDRYRECISSPRAESYPGQWLRIRLCWACSPKYSGHRAAMDAQ